MVDESLTSTSTRLSFSKRSPKHSEPHNGAKSHNSKNSHNDKNCYDQDQGGDENGTALATVFFAEEADDAVEYAIVALLTDSRFYPKLLSKDLAKGCYTVRSVGRSIIRYNRLGFQALVGGQPFDSVSFRELGTLQEWRRHDVMQKQDDVDDRMLYYIVSGSCGIFRKHKDGRVSKVESRHAGTIVGEDGFFLTESHYGTLSALEDGTITIKFTRASFEILKERAPVIADRLHVCIIQTMTKAAKAMAHELNLLLRPSTVQVDNPRRRRKKFSEPYSTE